MKTKLWLAGLAALAFVGMPVSSAPRMDDDIVVGQSKSEVLQGIEGVRVYVEDISKDAVADGGLTRESIQTAVELELRRSGIEVFDAKKLFATPGMPELYVNVNGVKVDNLYACSYDIELQENVTTVRQVGLIGHRSKLHVAGAVTWRKGGTGIVGAAKLADVRNALVELADKFCNDYLKANPKKLSTN